MLDDVDYPTSMRNHPFPLYHQILPEQQQGPVILGYRNFLAVTRERASFPFCHRFPMWSWARHLGCSWMFLLIWCGTLSQRTPPSFPPPPPPQHIVPETLTFWWAVTFHQNRRNLPGIQSAKEIRSILSNRNTLAHSSYNLMTQDEPLWQFIAIKIEMFLLFLSQSLILPHCH